MNKTKYKILFIFTLSGIAVMTACGNTTESSAAPTPANSSVVLGESTEQSEASVDNDSITELDFSNINGFGVSAEYGDPYAKGKNWDITEKLYMELSALENRGVTIWLEGTPSNSLNVSNQLSIHEDTSYMRDYVFEEGRLKEVHFDKVSK